MKVIHKTGTHVANPYFVQLSRSSASYMIEVKMGELTLDFERFCAENETDNDMLVQAGQNLQRFLMLSDADKRSRVSEVKHAQAVRKSLAAQSEFFRNNPRED